MERRTVSGRVSAERKQILSDPVCKTEKNTGDHGHNSIIVIECLSLPVDCYD
jgi:hypothetical protein